MISKESLPFSSFLKDFNKGKVWPYKTWSEHVSEWSTLGRENIITVRYEDLLTDTNQELRRMLEFTGITIESKRIENAVEGIKI